MFAPTQKDAYKIGHVAQYPPGITEVYSNLTARSGKLSNVPNDGVVCFVGLQHFLQDYLINEWNESFFSWNKDVVVEKYRHIVTSLLGIDVDVEHIAALHDLGYLPIVIKALPEGSIVPYGVPLLTIKNTLPEFYWLTNMLESVLSSEIWLPITTATTFLTYRRLFERYAIETGSNGIASYQGHDFSYRGMAGRHAAAISGFAALAAGSHGTDCVAAMELANDFYDAGYEEIGGSIPGSEHSVMCAGGEESEVETYRRMLTDVYPTGPVAIVSDTWDFWNVVENTLSELKDLIMSRDGSLVIRPDSGDPVEIICGVEVTTINCETYDSFISWAEDELRSRVESDREFGRPGVDDESGLFRWVSPTADNGIYDVAIDVEYNRFDKTFYVIENTSIISVESYQLSCEEKGLIESLWDTFGGTINSLGFKVLDSHIGAIYGDSITYDRAEQILRRLKAKGFASGNIIFGIGSYTYQHVTRDTHGMAIKSTHVVVDGVDRPIFKDPKTDSGTKKSAKGYLRVDYAGGKYVLVDQLESDEGGHLQEVFRDGDISTENFRTLRNIRQTVDVALSRLNHA